MFLYKPYKKNLSGPSEQSELEGQSPFYILTKTEKNIYLQNKKNTGKLFAIDDLPVMILNQLAGAVGELIAIRSLLHCG